MKSLDGLPEKVAVVEVDLELPAETIRGLEGFDFAELQFVHAGRYVGRSQIRVKGGRVESAQVVDEAINAADHNLTGLNPSDAGLDWMRRWATLYEQFPVVHRTLPIVDGDGDVPTLDLAQPHPASVVLVGTTNLLVVVGEIAIGEISLGEGEHSFDRVADVIAGALSFSLLAPQSDSYSTWVSTLPEIAEEMVDVPGLPMRSLNQTTAVSIVVATFDRPDDLRRCLVSLNGLRTDLDVEIVVVDNNPSSGRTRAVLDSFPDVVAVIEERPGLSYARNRGISASRGDIIVCTDDDVVVPDCWLDQLLRPFADDRIGAVTGNVLPIEFGSKAQQLFEQYGGLGRGRHSFSVGPDWLESFEKTSPPTWDLGATANAAFRRSALDEPQVGWLDERLGAGSPTGCSEDTYLFYKLLRNGWHIEYVPGAFVWHKHRDNEEAFLHQLYSYSKGGTAYHLMLAFEDRDMRGLQRLFVELPGSWIWRFREFRSGANDFPPRYMLRELRGAFAGVWATVASYRRVRRLGRKY